MSDETRALDPDATKLQDRINRHLDNQAQARGLSIPVTVTCAVAPLDLEAIRRRTSAVNRWIVQAWTDCPGSWEAQTAVKTHLVTDVPALLAEVERLRAEVERQRIYIAMMAGLDA